MFNTFSTTAMATNPDRIMHKAMFTNVSLLIVFSFQFLQSAWSQISFYLGCLILSLRARLLDYFND